jgi:hypothetical protein
MADKFLGSEGTQRLWERISAVFVKKDGNKVLSDNNFSDADKEKLDSLHNYKLPIASAETLGGIKIGEGLVIDAEGTVSTVITPGATINWSQVVETPTDLEGYGITDAATKEELAELEAKIVGVFHYKGSVATEADLDNIENPEVGDVYNVLENGKNFAWDGEAWDDLGGFIDLSGYWSKDELVPLTADEIDIITGFATSYEAMKEIIANGGDLTIADDMQVSESLSITKDLIVDLNGNDITSSVAAPLFDVKGATLTLKGNGNVSAARHIAVATNGGKIVIESGNYTTSNEGFKAVGEGAEITMNGGTLISQECGLGVNRGATLIMNGGTVQTIDNMGIGTNGSDGEGSNTIIMNGGEVIGNIISDGYEAVGAYIANNDTFTMNGGSIIGNGGAGIVMRAGTVTINGGYIEGKSSENRPAGSTGWVGDNKTKMTQSGIIYHESANYPGKAGMSLTVTGGTIKGEFKSLEVLSNEVEPAVVVTGGEFTPAYQPID